MEPRGLWDEPPPPEPPVDEVRGQPRRQVGPVVLTVGEVNRLVRDSLRRQPRLNPVWVEGEIGNVSVSAAGHAYFTLKDERAQLRCVVFRDERLALPLEPRTGLRVVEQSMITTRLNIPTCGAAMPTAAGPLRRVSSRSAMKARRLALMSLAV